MEQRIQYTKYSAEALKAMLAMERHLKGCGLEEGLLHMIRLRASQLNGCAFCLDMHWKDARALGETEKRLYGLDAWRESPYYTPRERAALAWTEAVTLVAETHVPDEVYEEARKEFTENELIDLTYAVMSINAWNRMAIAMRVVPGEYQSAQKKASAT